MPSGDAGRIPILQGTLDLIVLRTLATMGPQHAYAIAQRWSAWNSRAGLKGTWGKTDSNREAKFYAITKAGEKALAQETLRWRRMTGLVEKLLSEGA